MPELPEVETTLRGIAPYIQNQTITHATVCQPKLRWAVPADLSERLQGETVRECVRYAN